MSSEKAARIICDGLERGRTRIVFSLADEAFHGLSDAHSSTVGLSATHSEDFLMPFELSLSGVAKRRCLCFSSSNSMSVGA